MGYYAIETAVRVGGRIGNGSWRNTAGGNGNTIPRYIPDSPATHTDGRTKSQRNAAAVPGSQPPLVQFAAGQVCARWNRAFERHPDEYQSIQVTEDLCR